MAWKKTDADRARDAKVYGDPEYKRNKAVVRRRSGGRCEVIRDGRPCGSRDRVQCDHIIPVSQGGTHHLDNLRDACKPCHDKKTALEGGFVKTGKRGRGGWGNRSREDPALQPRTKWLSSGTEKVNQVELGRDRAASIYGAPAIRRIHVVTFRG